MKKANLKPRLNVVVIKVIALTLIPIFSVDVYAQEPLTFEKTIKLAQKFDPWLTGNRHKQKAIESMSTATSTLPDPKVSVGLVNMPTDSFDFNQEGMTQAKIGITQMFPRGDTLDIKSEQLLIQSEAYPYQRQDRSAKVAVSVGSLWLNAYLIQQSIALIEKDRALFEQLSDVAEASYSASYGRTRQQDIIRAQLELTRLDERLDKLRQQKSRYEGMLMQWLSVFSTESEDNLSVNDASLHNVPLSNLLPQIDLLNHELVYKKSWHNSNDLIPLLSVHPAVIALDKKIKATKTGIRLAEQKYKPEWGVNASYGYRDDDLMGQSRADLFSVGISFDLPLFTENRQDKEVQSAISETEAVKSEKILLLRELLGSFSSAKGRLLRLQDRKKLYSSQLLPQIHEQAEASLTAYTNDDGDFAEVVRSRIAVLNAEIDNLALNVEEQKITLELNYLFIGNLNTTEADMNFEDSKQHNAIYGDK
ncbi:TolC family protein [Algibacillus agarilyticus]|uniref:TolC family protein n=1 Tax=Algibacillus agarilyticus TaxID=2234133 RepID=UPI000DD03B05|nr:TolC family protein [Algibacillus agarilyticus]